MPSPIRTPAGTNPLPVAEPADVPQILQWPWQRQLAAAIRDPARLLAALELSNSQLAERLEQSRAAARQFPVVVPHSFLARIKPGDPADPLLKQVFADPRELESREDFPLDPVGDGAARVAPGMLHKYQGRVLLITAGSCAVNCRYCFRRHYPYSEAPRRFADWEPALDQIAGDPSIAEVLLSGGDPLVLSDERLDQLIAAIEAIPHVRRLRIHTRLPIVLPARVTGDLIERLVRGRLTPVLVVHANHVNELAGDCAAALTRLTGAGRILVLNQAVLLAGVNDSTAALTDLSERLIDLGVRPYYLNQLDRVAGAAHFDVPQSRGLELIRELGERLPGYAVPRYVQDFPGATAKRVLTDRSTP